MIYLPSHFVKIDEELFWHLLGNLNWQRDAYCGGEQFTAKGWEIPQARTYADGRTFTEMRDRVIAVTTENGHFINPEFFPKET